MKKFFENIFGQKSTPESEIPTQPLPPEPQPVPVTREALEPVQFIAGCAQSIGRQRDHNEDALFTLNTTMSSSDGSLPFGLFMVADGMGGHQFGEVASGIAIRTVAGTVVRKLFSTLLNPHQASPEQSLLEIMQEAAQEAHRAIARQVPGGGTTLTAILILGNQMTVTHIGDSRAYIFKEGGVIDMLTRDHSLVKRLLELGRITTDEAAVHPQRNVLYRALGQGEQYDPDINTMQLPESGYLLICSDGLWGLVPDEELYRLAFSTSCPEEACQKMVDAANEAGGPDNITAILVRLPG